LLSGDAQYDLSIQSIIDKLSTPDSFTKVIQKFKNVFRRDEASFEHLLNLENDFKCLSEIHLGNDDNQVYYFNPPMLKTLLNSIKELVTVFIQF